MIRYNFYWSDQSQNELLRKKSHPITDIVEIERFIRLLEQELDKEPTGIGLSAIQIGIPVRLAIIKNQNQKINLINPTIIETKLEFTHINESCLSVPRYKVDVRRFQQVTIKNHIIVDGTLQPQVELYYCDPTIKEPDLTAVAIQHEIDHMNGILILDKPYKREPIISPVKIGRNDPCSCNSGKKYKKCCGGK
jgi:peptide deformylase